MTDPKEDPSLEQAMGGEKEIQERPTRPIEVFNSEEMARQFQADRCVSKEQYCWS